MQFRSRENDKNTRGCKRICLFYSPSKCRWDSGIFDAILVAFALHIIEIPVDFSVDSSVDLSTVIGVFKNSVRVFEHPLFFLEFRFSVFNFSMLLLH